MVTYEDILKWADKNFPHVGVDIYKYLALQPASLLMPPIPSRESFIRPQMNFLILGPPGIFKSTFCRAYASLLPKEFNPINLKRITAAELQDSLEGLPHASLIVDDFARMSKDMALVKVLEGLIEEGEVNDQTKKTSYQYKIKVTGTFMGVPEDLHSNLTSGFLGRVTAHMLTLKEDEQEEIGEHLSACFGNISGSEKRDDIHAFYQKLFDLQKSKETQITGYVLDDSVRDLILAAWKDVRDKLKNGQNSDHWFREIGEGIRFTCASAMLNRATRELTSSPGGGLLIKPNDADVILGTKLMKICIANKYYIFQWKQFEEKRRRSKLIQQQSKKIRSFEEGL